MTCSQVLKEQGEEYPKTCAEHGLHCPPTDREVEKELGISEVADSEIEPSATGPHLVLNLEGDHAVFEARGQKANQYLMVKYVDQLATPGYPTTRAVTKLALGQVKVSEQPRLEAYLEEHGFVEDYDQALYDALSACWSGETMLPLVRSSDS